jgi:hypothetical protein
VISDGEFTRIEENLFGFVEINYHSKICRGWAFEILKGVHFAELIYFMRPWGLTWPRFGARFWRARI